MSDNTDQAQLESPATAVALDHSPPVQTVEELANTLYTARAGYSAIEELTEMIKPTVVDFMQSNGLSTVSISAIADDGASQTVCISVPDPEGLDAKEQEDWNKRKKQAIFTLAIELSRVRLVLEQKIKNFLSQDT